MEDRRRGRLGRAAVHQAGDLLERAVGEADLVEAHHLGGNLVGAARLEVLPDRPFGLGRQRADAKVEGEADQRPPLMLGQGQDGRVVQHQLQPAHGVRRVLAQQEQGLGRGDDQAIDHVGAGVAPADGQDAAAVAVGGQAAALGLLQELQGAVGDRAAHGERPCCRKLQVGWLGRA